MVIRAVIELLVRVSGKCSRDVKERNALQAARQRSQVGALVADRRIFWELVRQNARGVRNDGHVQPQVRVARGKGVDGLHIAAVLRRIGGRLHEIVTAAEVDAVGFLCPVSFRNRSRSAIQKSRPAN